MSKLKKAGLITGLITLVIILGGVILVHLTNAPVQGKISNNLVPTGSNSPPFDLSPVPVNGTYVTFAYPKSLSIKPTQTNSGQIIEQHLYGYQATPQPWLLSLNVNNVGTTGLSNDSSYTVRKDNPAQYSETTKSIGGNVFYIFKDNNASGYAETAFTVKGTKSTDISLTGSDQPTQTNLENTFNMVVSSFKWK